MAKLEGVKTVDMVGGEITKISYEGAEYVRVDGEAKEGDIGLVVSRWGSQEVGEYYVITRVSGDILGRSYYHVEGKVREANCRAGSMNTFRKIPDEQTTPTLAEVSDKVDAIEKRVGALEGGDLKVGDYVKPLPGASEYFIIDEDMTLGKVVEEGGLFGDIRVEVIAHKTRTEEIGEVYGVQSKHFRKATDEEIAEATAPKFEVGDYARTLTVSRYGGVGEGNTVKVTKIHTDGNIAVEPAFGEEANGIYRSHQLEKLEGEDVERIAQFAKVGRTFEDKSEPIIPQEGDVVRVSNYEFNYGEPFKPGDIGIVVGADGTMIPSVEINGHTLFAHVEVIARSKDRVDSV